MEWNVTLLTAERTDGGINNLAIFNMTKNNKNSKNKSKAALAVAAVRRRQQRINESYLTFPIKSRYYDIGARLLAADPSNPRNNALAVDAFLRGSRTDGCVRCMHMYCWYHEYIHGANMMQLLVRLPWIFEAAIRGDYNSMAILISLYCDNSQQQANKALYYYWSKRLRVLHPQIPNTTKEELKSVKERHGDRCVVCKIACCDDPRALIQCIGCSYYCYCSKEHQIEHWNTWNHRGECKQLQILNTYHKAYAKQIHQAILRGHDPATIRELQLLRTKLGLNRPTEDYKDLVAKSLQNSNRDDDYNTVENEGGTDTTQDNNTNDDGHIKRCVARNDGTVHIGSTPEMI